MPHNHCSKKCYTYSTNYTNTNYTNANEKNKQPPPSSFPNQEIKKSNTWINWDNTYKLSTSYPYNYGSVFYPDKSGYYVNNSLWI